MSNDLIQYESDDGFEYDDTVVIHEEFTPRSRKREGMLRKTKRTLKDYFRRLYYCRQMDFEYAISLMIYLWKDPFKVHNTFTKFHKRIESLFNNIFNDLYSNIYFRNKKSMGKR